MTQSKQTKRGERNSGEKPKKYSAEEINQIAENESMSSLVLAMKEQDAELDPEEELLQENFEDEEPWDDEEDDENAGPEPEDEEDGESGTEVDAESGISEEAQEETAADSADPAELEKKKSTELMTHKSIVSGINERTERCLEKGAREIGEFGLDAIYGGDVDQALTANHRKSALFKKIAADPELKLNPKRLSEFIGAAALRRDLIRNGVEVSNLTTSILVNLVMLKDKALRMQLAQEANEHRYSVRKVKTLIRELIPKGPPEDVGRTLMRKIGQPLSLLDDDEFFRICSNRELLLRDLSGTERRKILAQIQEGKPRLKVLEELVDTLESALKDIEKE